LSRRQPPSESGTFAVTTRSGGVLRFSPDRRELRIGQRTLTLDEAECRLLQALVEERAQVVTRTALMIAAWGAATPEQRAALQNAMDRLIERLAPDLTIETVTGIGYRLL
jgi:DNA-binding response OmpR family regulator